MTRRWGQAGWGGWVWVVLMAALVLPLPFRAVPFPERGVPIVFILLAGALCLFGRVARVSLPLGLLMVYLLGTTLAGGGDRRGFELLLLLTLAGALFVEAAGMGGRWARRVAWALLFAVASQGILGLLNLWGLFPSPYTLTKPLHWLGLRYEVIDGLFGGRIPLRSSELYRAAGWLTHPNYWGSYIALGVAPAYWLLGWSGGVLVLVFAGASVSVGPVASAAAAFFAMAWHDPRWPRRLRTVTAAALVLMVVSLAGLHVWSLHEWPDYTNPEHLLSGRGAVWAAGVEFGMEKPWFGHGLGAWRRWAEHYNRMTQSVFATLQAHNEPVQAFVEFGAVGLALLAAALAMTLRAMRRGFRGPEAVWAGVLVAAFVNSLGSPTFHLPAQGAVAVFALGRVLSHEQGGS